MYVIFPIEKSVGIKDEYVGNGHTRPITVTSLNILFPANNITLGDGEA